MLVFPLSLDPNVKPETFVETCDHANPQFYNNNNIIIAFNAFIVQSKSRFLDYVFIDTDLAPPKAGANDVIEIDHVHCF